MDQLNGGSCETKWNTTRLPRPQKPEPSYQEVELSLAYDRRPQHTAPRCESLHQMRRSERILACEA